MKNEKVKPLALPARVQRAEEAPKGAVFAPESTPIQQRRTILSALFEERRREGWKKKLSPEYPRVQKQTKRERLCGIG